MTVTRSKYKRKQNDLYETERWATQALLNTFEHLHSLEHVWEPSAGNHKIAEVLQDNLYDVITSDIKEYRLQHDFIMDFLNDTPPPLIFNELAPPQAIITNPPYGTQNHIAARYARRALELADHVALLLTAKFDCGNSRLDLFQNNPRFMGKLTLVDRLRFFDDKSGTEDHAWYLWGPDEYEPRIWYAGNYER